MLGDAFYLKLSHWTCSKGSLPHTPGDQVMTVKDSVPWGTEEVLLCLDLGAREGILEEVVPRLSPTGGSLRQRVCLFSFCVDTS